VLDRLLEQDGLEIDGLVGTSAGAMNAAATAYGLSIGEADGARHVLHQFWKKNLGGGALLAPAADAVGQDDEPGQRFARKLAGLHHHRFPVAHVLALPAQTRPTRTRCARCCRR